MAKYVVLNFEDRYLDTARGAADSTVQALTMKYEQNKQPGKVMRLFVGKNSLVEHRCVEVNSGVIGFTTDATRLQQIRTDCSSAEKIYVVAHGDPRTTDVCYTNDPNGVGVVQLADYNQLATFLKSIILPRKDVIRIALIMCYGARCRNYRRAQIDHMGAIASADLATSFAYQLYKPLAQTLSVRMSAVTGKIQHDNTSGRALVEVEEMIDENMEFAEAAKAQTQSKGPLLAQLKNLQASGVKESEIKQKEAYYRLNPNAWAATPVEVYAKGLIAWENNAWTDASGQNWTGTQLKQRVENAKGAKRTAIQNLQANNMDEMMPKYGKFIYTYKSGVLKIVSKYGNPGGTNVGPGTVLYQGALL
ncbi:MAG TPA: hypothetical protein VFA04_04725 [Bryobacteraceae bacterium]|nr:hypothetical protein [Bryobacteraceae bacterium]